MLTTGHTKIDAVLTTYRTILAETIDTLAGAQGEVAALTADLAAARVSLEAAQKDVVQRDARINAQRDARINAQRDARINELTEDNVIESRPSHPPFNRGDSRGS
jgi:uncharacterized protein YaiL (DUF2058 family)